MIWAIILAGLVFIPALVYVLLDRSVKKTYRIQGIVTNDRLTFGDPCTVNVYYDKTGTNVYIQSEDLRFRDMYDLKSLPVFRDNEVVIKDNLITITIDTCLDLLIITLGEK